MSDKFEVYCARFSILASAIIYVLFFRDTTGIINIILNALALGIFTFLVIAFLIVIFKAANDSDFGKYLCPCIVAIIIGTCVNYFNYTNNQINDLEEDNRLKQEQIDYLEQAVEDYKDQIYELEDQLYDFENNFYY